jgi:hypothetical protein
MMRRIKFLLVFVVLFLFSALPTMAQTSGTISAVVTDVAGAAIPNAKVTVRNVQTNETRTAQTNEEGRHKFLNLAVGSYELTVEAPNFAKYIQTGIGLLLNQDAVINVSMQVASIKEVVTVTSDASVLNTSNAEVGVRFDNRRLSELPLGTNRNVLGVALSAPGVSQLGSGQTGFANGISYSANGGRVRSNNFMIDGQDNNEPGVSGATQPINNPDIVQEVRLITNQFLAEFGRNSSSVFNAITKSGTNDWHGTAFWFHNSNALNACSNLDKAASFCNPNATNPSRRHAPFRIENQFGFTFGGPLHLPRFGEGGPSIINGRNRTFFFVSLQRWSDRQLGSGTTLNGAPTEAGRQILQAAAGHLPQVAALLRFLPAAQTPTNSSAIFTIGGQTYTVPLGAITGSTAFTFNNWQPSIRIDHRIGDNHTLTGRYLYSDSDTKGTGQATPAGLTTQNLSRQQSALISLTSTLSPRMVNDLRVGYQRLATTTSASDPRSEEIPSIEIAQLGLTGFNAAASRTAIGLAVNLPQFRFNNIYQFQDNLSFTSGNHSMKFGVNVVNNRVKSFFFPTIRGLLRYDTLNNYVNDLAQAANINKPLPGGADINYYEWYDTHFYGQDEWKIRPNFTLTYGLRYELPGEATLSLVPLNDSIVKVAGGDTRFALTPVPKKDKNNFQPRIGFNWNLRTREDGIIGFFTGGDKLVLRSGFARTNDYTFINIALNVASSFPFVAAVSLPTQLIGGANLIPNAYTRLPTVVPSGLNPLQLTRTVVGEDFRSPTYDSFNLEVQRELSSNLIFRVGYVGSKGNSIFQTIDGNPRITTPCTPTATNTCRVDPTRGVIRLRANAASSIYHSMQVSVDKRLSKGFSAGVHYTWSSFIDSASEIFNPSSGEVAVAQNSFNRRADRGRSAYDRPHRLSGNFVYELPFYRDQKGFVGHLLGGWQINGFFTFQSGAPFTILNGSDPAGALSGINSLVGDAIRPNINTNLPLSSMTIEEILAAGGRSLFRLLGAGERVGGAGRNILRADGINNFDFGLFKNTRITENQRLQLRAEFYNFTNTRDFGIPEGRANSSNFLNQWGTNGGNRRVVVGIRYIF